MWENSKGVFDVFILIMSMGGVIALAYFSTKWLSRRFTPMGGTNAVKVIDRVYIAQDKSLIIVQVVQKYLLLSVTPHSIQKICEISEDEMAEVLVHTAKEESFRTLFEGAFNQKHQQTFIEKIQGGNHNGGNSR